MMQEALPAERAFRIYRVRKDHLMIGKRFVECRTSELDDLQPG